MFLGEFEAEGEIFAFDQAERLIKTRGGGWSLCNHQHHGEASSEKYRGGDRSAHALSGQSMGACLATARRVFAAVDRGVDVVHHLLNP